ncbi:MAG: alkaline phosphatase [Arenibacter latericius]|nr:alkaline phosphatase [Arenibacter latericius]
MEKENSIRIQTKQELRLRFISRVKSALLSFILIIFGYNLTFSQSVHSHNDYKQKVPFWAALSSGASSIEVDLFLKNDTLYVTHEEAEIVVDRTIENLYLEPLQSALSLEIGRKENVQILIDLKSEAISTLRKLISVLEKYPKITGNEKIILTISGNRPPIESYLDYPSYIHFDLQSLEALNNEALWDKVSLISLNFKKYSAWNGLGRLISEDYNKVKTIIDKAHSYGKPFRFWATPDTKTAWRSLTDLGVDYINTDMPYECMNYLKTLNKRTYRNQTFSEVYIPNYVSDQKNSQVKNVILLIGDGNGLNQITAATLANGGALTLTQLKSIGFIKTASTDDFTTDSAAAGTALATGYKTYNRSIGLDTLKRPLTNLPELLSSHGFVSGCITTDRLTGATPASFYAHQEDRSLIAAIAADLPKSKLSLFIAGGKEDFNDIENLSRFTIIDRLNDIGKSKIEKIGYFLSDGAVPSIKEGRNNILEIATMNGIEFLKAKNKPFFLMIEGAMIDKFAHKNDVAGIVSEGIDFDRAITQAIKFADESGETLVIITADHETSGFSIPQGDLRKMEIEGDFTTNDHTAAMVPIFAYGPHSHNFQGVYENSEVFKKIIKILQID